MSRYLDLFHSETRVASVVSVESPPPLTLTTLTALTTRRDRASPHPPNGANDTNGMGHQPGNSDHQGGLPRRGAKAVADACHPAPLPELEPADWVEWFQTETARRTPGLGEDAAERRVWGIALNLWHRWHGERLAPGCCAGCGRPVGQGFRLPDGTAIHDDARFIDCLIRYGHRWRGRAAAGLSALGLREPDEGGDR